MLYWSSALAESARKGAPIRFKPWIPKTTVEITLGEPSRLFLWITAFFGPAYARTVLRLGRIEILGRERLIEEYRRAASDEGRFIIAYRHPDTTDPHLVFHVLTNLLKGRAAATGSDGRPGAWYPSGTEVQLWAGSFIVWALRNAGIVPVRHGGVDRAVLDYLVRGIAERRRPMAIAPEGMSTFQSGASPELDPGVSRLAILAADRLAAAGRPMPVRILPIAIEYSFSRTASVSRLARFVSRLELRVGLEPENVRSEKKETALEEISVRLKRIWERLVDIAEAAYSRSWGIKPAPSGASLRDRILVLSEATVGRLEAFYGVTPAANLKARILNVRAESLRRVFYEAGELASFSPLERGIARRGAAESYFLDQIYLAAALGLFLNPSFEEKSPDFDRLAETAVNLHDLANRLEGMGLKHRSRYFRRDARLVVGEPLDAFRREGEGRHAAASRVERELEEGFIRLMRTD